jgi:hypothetical protein
VFPPSYIEAALHVGVRLDQIFDQIRARSRGANDANESWLSCPSAKERHVFYPSPERRSDAVGNLWRDLQQDEAIVSRGKVNWLIDKAFQQASASPSTFARVDLTGCEVPAVVTLCRACCAAGSPSALFF